MASKHQPKVFCKISDYVSQVDPELAQIIKDTCVEMSLNSLKGKNGVTFLLPEDKSFREELKKLAYSDKIDDVMAAADKLNALILRDGFKSAADWNSSGKFLANSLYPPQIVEVKGASGKSVEFASGAKATLDDKFVTFKDRKKPLAVWRLTSGSIPVTSDKPFGAAPKPSQKTGGYDPGNLESQSLRFKIALAIENEYALRRLSGAPGGAQRMDAYCEHSLSLFHYLSQHNKSLLVDRVLPLLCLDKLDLYVMLEPHRLSGDYLINDETISNWYASHHRSPISYKEVESEFQQLLRSSGGALIYTDRLKVAGHIENIRKALDARAISAPRACVDAIEAEYEKLISENAIGGLGPIYPEGAIEYYRSNPGLKMIHDELRYLTYCSFRELERAPSFDSGRFNELVNMIGECLFVSSNGNTSGQHKLLSKSTLKYLIDPHQKIQEVRTFLNSTCFMHIPYTLDECEKLKHTDRKHPRDLPEDKVPRLNISRDLYHQHQRIIDLSDRAIDQSQLVRAIKSLNVDNLDEETKKLIREKFASA